MRKKSLICCLAIKPFFLPEKYPVRKEDLQEGWRKAGSPETPPKMRPGGAGVQAGEEGPKRLSAVADAEERLLGL
jgi:hypothetical protein